jgi:recombination protein RecR
MLPKAIQNVIDEFTKLPGIGPKSAERLAFHLLRREQRSLESFSEAVSKMKKDTVFCDQCCNITDVNPCRICSHTGRDQSLVCVVEESLDVYAVEKTGEFRGVYHVLHGALSPIDNIGPDNLTIGKLIDRIATSGIAEIIFATNPTPKGESTSLYIMQKIRVIADTVKMTHLAHGIPMGGEIEYADFETLGRALRGRISY